MAAKIKPAGKKQGNTQPAHRPASFVARFAARDSTGGMNWLRELYAKPPAGQKVVR